MKTSLVRRSLFAAGAALLLIGGLPPAAMAQNKILLRISTPAVPDDWHAKMWTVFKESLDKSAPGEFDVQINLNATLFKQGTEPAAMARGNLELASISAFDIAKLVPGVLDLHRRLRHPRSRAPAEGVQRPDRRGDVQARRREDGRHGAVDDLPRHARRSTCARCATCKDPGRPQGREAAHAGLARNGCSSARRWAPPRRRWPSARSTWALKTGTIDGQDNPLPTVRAAKFYEVTKQLVLTSHLVDGIFLVDREQDLERAHARRRSRRSRPRPQAAAQYNNENRIKEEGQLVDFFKQQGLQVATPDVDAFRKHVQARLPRVRIRQGLAEGPARAHQRDEVGADARLAEARRPTPSASRLFAALFLTFIVQITARFVFDRPLPWTDELAVILYVWVILWAAAFMVPARDHVVFDLVCNTAGPRTRRGMLAPRQRDDRRAGRLCRSRQLGLRPLHGARGHAGARPAVQLGVHALRAAAAGAGGAQRARGRRAAAAPDTERPSDAPPVGAARGARRRHAAARADRRSRCSPPASPTSPSRARTWALPPSRS